MGALDTGNSFAAPLVRIPPANLVLSGVAPTISSALFWTPPIAGYVNLWDVTNSNTRTLVDSGGDDFVSQIDDQGSSNTDMTAPLTFRPFFPGGFGTRSDCCTFDGAAVLGDIMTAASVPLDGDQTVFIVMDLLAGGGADILWEHSVNWNSNDGGGSYYDWTTNTLQYFIRRSSTNSAKDYPSSLEDGLPHILRFRADGTHANQEVWEDGIQLSGTSLGPGYNNDVGTGSVTTGLYLGCRAATPSTAMPMEYGLMLIYNSTLSNGDCDLIEASLAGWFGI